MQLPGIGLIHAMTSLAAIGEVTRFAHARQLVGYSGLGAGVHDSGQTHRGGRSFCWPLLTWLFSFLARDAIQIESHHWSMRTNGRAPPVFPDECLPLTLSRWKSHPDLLHQICRAAQGPIFHNFAVREAEFT
jgi:hypothetical protein